MSNEYLTRSVPAVIPLETIIPASNPGEIISFDGTKWTASAAPTGTLPEAKTSGDVVSWDGTKWTAAPAPAVALPEAKTSGDVVSWDGTKWTAAAPAASSGTTFNESKLDTIAVPIDLTTSYSIISGDMFPQWVARVADNNDNRDGYICKVSDGVVSSSGFNSSAYIYSADGSLFQTINYHNLLTTWITKYNKDGVAQWVAKMESDNHIYSGLLAADPADNIYVCCFHGTATTRAYNSDGTVFGTTVEPMGHFDVVFAKYNSAGMVQWITKIGGTDGDYPNDLALYDEFIYVAVSGPSPQFAAYNADGSQFAATFSNSGSDDGYIIKYGQNGIVQWMSHLSGNGWDGNLSISADSYGVYASCVYQSNTLSIYDKNNTAFATTLNKNCTNAVAFVKLNHDGLVQWVAKIDNRSALSSIGAYVALYNNELYACVNFDQGNALVYNSNGTMFAELGLTDTSNIALVKYDKFGIAQWAHVVGSTGMTFSDLVVNEFGIFTTGHFSNSTFSVYNFDGTLFQTFNKSPSNAVNNTFVIHFNHRGNVIWAVPIHGYDVYPMGIALDNTDIYINGHYNEDTLHITLPDGQNDKTIPKTYTKDTFTVKYKLASAASVANPTNIMQKSITFTTNTPGSCGEIRFTSPLMSNNKEYNKVFLQNSGSSITMVWNGTSWLPSSTTNAILVE